MEVHPGGPAAEAGIKEGDVIVAFDGKPVAGPDELTALVTQVKPGTRVTVDVVRDGERTQLEVVIGSLAFRARIGSRLGAGGPGSSAPECRVPSRPSARRSLSGGLAFPPGDGYMQGEERRTRSFGLFIASGVRRERTAMMSDGTERSQRREADEGASPLRDQRDDLALELTHEDVLEVAIASGATAVELAVPIARTADLVRRGQPLRAWPGHRACSSLC